MQDRARDGSATAGIEAGRSRALGRSRFREDGAAGGVLGRGVAWRWWPLVGVIVALTFVAHGTLAASGIGSVPPAQQAATASRGDISPDRAADCTIDDPVALFWTTRDLLALLAMVAAGGSGRGILARSEEPLSAEASPVPNLPPSARRALLQVFLI